MADMKANMQTSSQISYRREAMRARDNVYVRLPIELKERLARESWEQNITQQNIVIMALEMLFAQWDQEQRFRRAK